MDEKTREDFAILAKEKEMKFPVKKGTVNKCAKEFANDFRLIRKSARQALMDRDAVNFKMYADQMKSYLEIEFVDPLGNVGRVITHLSEDEQKNPYQLSPLENAELSKWIFKAIKEKRVLH